MKIIQLTILNMLVLQSVIAQQTIPFDTTHWEIESQGHIFETVGGKEAIYLHNGSLVLKDVEFLNGTIEYDIRMTERRGFYGVRFHFTDSQNAEEFYFRPHQSGNPDANQATPIVNGLAGWQLYFGEAYSFAYDYPFEEWMHIKLVIKGKQAQVFLDGAQTPHLSWNLKQEPKSGSIGLYSSVAPIHYANFSYQSDVGELIDFKVKKAPLIEGVIESWTVSDKFEEVELESYDSFDKLIKERSWKQEVEIEENSAANLSWAAIRQDGTDKNTVFARIDFESKEEQLKLFQFGYSDRVVVILNGQPLYKGTNKFRSRDYRYLGTIGLFDELYLPVKKGKNTLLLAVSEDFGGWGVTGKFVDSAGLKIK